MSNLAFGINGYFDFLDQLSDDDKLELIAMLSLSLKSKKKKKAVAEKSLFGALDDAETAESWIARIHQSRNFTRQIEAL